MTDPNETNIIYQPLQALAYEGASTRFLEQQRDLLSGTHDQLAARELTFLQMRSQHAIRNNGYAKVALNKYLTNLGALKVNWKDKKGKEHPLMQELWDEFCLDPSLDGYGTLDNIQSLWNSNKFITGNSFTRLQIRRKKNNNRIPLKLEVLQSETHDLFYFGEGSNKQIKYGIEFFDTKPLNYFFRLGLFQEYWFDIQNNYKTISIPADEILHQFDREAPGQWLGIPSLSPVLISLYELDDLTNATIAKQKAAQAISWIIKNSNPQAQLPVGTPIYAKDEKGERKVELRANGTTVQYLNKFEDIAFNQGTDIGNNLITMLGYELRRIANAVDVPYVQLTGDLSGVDFSSLRALFIELRNRIEYIHHFNTIPLGLSPLSFKFKRLASLYYGKKVSNAFPTYQLPRFYGVDELKDAQADVLEIQNGLATLQSKLDERHTTYEQIAEDRKKIEELGLVNLLQPPKTSTQQGNNVNPNPNSTGI